MRNKLPCFILTPLLLLKAAGVRAQPSVPVPVRSSRAGPALPRAAAELELPGRHTFYLQAPTNTWPRAADLSFGVFWPAHAPDDAQVLVHVKDWDHFWYQNLPSGYLEPGRTNRFRVNFAPGSPDWHPSGHYGRWHMRAMLAPGEVGISVFGKTPYRGPCAVSGVRVSPRPPDRSAPVIASVRVNTNSVPCYGKFEVTFSLPDRYPNPFDPALIDVGAEIAAPDGSKTEVAGYYGRDYYWRVTEAGEELVPQGRPYWRVRFAPRSAGVHRYTLKARDDRGEARWGPSFFRALPSDRPGFIRVARRDPRCFEYTTGRPFFPIGHNIRSPFDLRMDERFPWAQRRREGSSAYARYFKAMAQHGENLAEVWSAAWSLGLEWHPRWRGYHGVGQYNMMNAWEQDQVLAEAERHGIHLNLIIHNHGKFSTWCDEEWKDNPFNIRNGGYLDRPEEYFTDPRALTAFENLMRYTIARWGYSPHIFAWGLWSELNLTGSKAKTYKSPEVVDWHDRMGRAVKTMDPNDHLVSTHVAADYRTQHEPIISLDAMDLCPVDAYHGNPDPLHIVTLMRQTEAYNRDFKKPVLITEFGGSHVAADLAHLKQALHAALWASTCIPMGGTPLFWWWQIIEEEHLYPEYAAVARFMQGVDRRDPHLLLHTGASWSDPILHEGRGVALATPHPDRDRVAVYSLQSRVRALGWLFDKGRYASAFITRSPLVEDLTLTLHGMRSGSYTCQFWDTAAGRPLNAVTAETEAGVLRFAVPPFACDLAFKFLSRRVPQE